MILLVSLYVKDSSLDGPKIDEKLESIFWGILVLHNDEKSASHGIEEKYFLIEGKHNKQLVLTSLFANTSTQTTVSWWDGNVRNDANLGFSNALKPLARVADAKHSLEFSVCDVGYYLRPQSKIFSRTLQNYAALTLPCLPWVPEVFLALACGTGVIYGVF